MPGPLTALGLLVVLLVMVDFLVTTVSLQKAGAITRLVARVTQRLVGHAPGPLAAYAGVMALTAVATTWILGLWSGWTMVFADAKGLLRGPEGLAVTGWDAAGFAGSALSTLGLGVLTPREAWLHLLVVVASVSGMVVLTLSVTYVLNVSQIATASRAMARRLDALRDACAEVESQDGSRELLLQIDTQLSADSHRLAESLDSFPLARVYESRGSERDVVRAAAQAGAAITRVRPRTAATPDGLRLRALRDAIGRLESA